MYIYIYIYVCIFVLFMIILCVFISAHTHIFIYYLSISIYCRIYLDLAASEHDPRSKGLRLRVGNVWPRDLRRFDAATAVTLTSVRQP